VTGYHPWWALIAGVNYPTALLDQVFMFEWEADPVGRIRDFRGWPGEWAGVTRELREEGVGVVPTLTLFGAESFEALFASTEARGRLRDELLEVMAGTVGSDRELAGLHVDVEVFEAVSGEARSGFSAFVASLSRGLRARVPGATLSLFLPALDLPDAYDESFLAEQVDYVVVQGYDLHYRTGPSAGPTSPLTGWDGVNLTAVLDRYAEMGVPPGKTILSLPLYGYEWPVVSAEPGAATRGAGVDLPWFAPEGVEPGLPRGREQMERYGARRPSAESALWYSYRADDGWRQGWVDDAASLSAKIELVRSRGVAGVAFFTLVYGDPDLWRELAPALR
jgi:spore germination protein YaaH